MVASLWPKPKSTIALAKFPRLASRLGQKPTTTSQQLLRSRLSNLLLQTLADVAHALVLVRVRRTQCAHFCRDLSHFLAINTAHCQFGLFWIYGYVDIGRQRILDRVR